MTRVLVVDDEPPIVRAVAANLRARGFEALTASTGEAALAAVEAHQPDCVVLDLGLPGIGGLEVLRRLRTWTEVPVVVLTAIDSERDKVAALDLGADDYVTKPFEFGELLARVRARLRARRRGDDVVELGGLRLMRATWPPVCPAAWRSATRMRASSSCTPNGLVT